MMTSGHTVTWIRYLNCYHVENICEKPTKKLIEINKLTGEFES